MSGARRAADPMRAARRLLAALTVAAAVLLTAGCGGEPPSDAVPALEEQLSDVDAAIAREDYPAAARALDELVRTTTEAYENGDLDEDQADAVLAAAGRLRGLLPEDEAGPAGEIGTEPAPPTTSEEQEPEESEESESPPPTDVAEDAEDSDDEGGGSGEQAGDHGRGSGEPPGKAKGHGSGQARGR